MYKILLVDDESIIRETIKKKIKWESLGFEVIGTCENGKEAIDFLQKERPDLILTDIYMPYVDGLELTKYVYQHFPETKVIIISGYDDFQYAKEAVKYKVEDYILKPVTSKELSEILMKIKLNLDQHHKEKEDFKKIKGAYRSQLPMARSRFLSKLILGQLPKEEIEEQLSEYEIDFQFAYYTVLKVSCMSSIKWLDKHRNFSKGLLSFTIFNVCEEITESFPAIIFQNNDSETMIILGSNQGSGIYKQARELGEKMIGLLKEHLHIPVTIGLGKKVDSLADLVVSYQSASQALDYSFTLGEGKVISYEEEGKLPKFSTISYIDSLEKIEVLLHTGKEEDLFIEVDKFIELLKDSFRTKEEMKIYVHNLLQSLASDNEFEHPMELRWEQLGTIQDLKVYLKHICDQARSHLDKDVVGMSSHRVMELAKEYMMKHYESKELSINDVAKYVNMSTSHFSALIKPYTGYTFVELLTKIRIDKAKELLLSTGLKTYEIADKVGYSDAHYFSSVFKKQTGLTPREFIKQHEVL